MCFKMSDLANLALKNGYYFEQDPSDNSLSSPKDDWIDSFSKVYSTFKKKEIEAGVVDEYSRNFYPFIQFLKILRNKKDYFKQKAVKVINLRRTSRPSSIDRDCQTDQVDDVESKIEESYRQVKQLIDDRDASLVMQLDEKNTRIELLEAQITDFKKISEEY